MPNDLPDGIFRELISKLTAAGVPERQAQDFAERSVGFQNCDPAYFELFENQRILSDDCFRTLAEAQNVFRIHRAGNAYAGGLEFLERYLKVPYSDVLSAKRTMCAVFGGSEAEVEELYAQEPEWLLICADSVKEFAAFLDAKFADPELSWAIYRKAALLGLETTQRRIDAVLELLGPEAGRDVIRDDIRGDGWLYYRWYSDPVGCIEYMLQCGLAPEKILVILKQEPLLLYLFKENRKRSYNHDQEYIDRMISKYLD